ncbi:MAG: methylated-DNA--[protein]-cysteine S-methyltransferase [Pseudomonadota bacterium]
MTQFSLFPTSIGHCGIAWRSGVVVATNLPERSTSVTAARIAERAKASEGQPPPEIQYAIESIGELLEGEKTDLSEIICDFSHIDQFEVGVYVATRDIPPGETKTYGDIAVRIGNKRFAQNVGRALGRNPFPIIVPCHRVLGANGKLTGFSAHGGVSTKLKMLEIEGARFSESPGLFDNIPPQ